VGGKGGGGGRGEKWTKPCMHIWIIKEKWKKKRNYLGERHVTWFAMCKKQWEISAVAGILARKVQTKMGKVLNGFRIYVWNNRLPC
jgi:hypothetical protein